MLNECIIVNEGLKVKLYPDKVMVVELPRPQQDGDSQTKKNFRYFFWSFFTAPSSRRFVILYLGCLWLHCGHGGGVCGNADIPSFLCVSFVFR